MTIFHRRWRRRMSLLASGALTDPARRRAEAHRDLCAPCARDLGEMYAAVAALAGDPARDAEMPIALSALRARVLARLEGGPAPFPERSRASWPWPRPVWATAGALGIVAAVLATPGIRGPAHPASSPASPSTAEVATAPRPEALPEPVLISEETLVRLERNLARERTARFLSEAEDVLVTVASHAEPCARGAERVDMADEARRSRELLARRSLVELDSEKTPQAQGVLEDVEQVLRDVAALESCARPRDLEAIHRDLKDLRLLMKIDLMTRELQG